MGVVLWGRGLTPVVLGVQFASNVVTAGSRASTGAPGAEGSVVVGGEAAKDGQKALPGASGQDGEGVSAAAGPPGPSEAPPGGTNSNRGGAGGASAAPPGLSSKPRAPSKPPGMTQPAPCGKQTSAWVATTAAHRLVPTMIDVNHDRAANPVECRLTQQHTPVSAPRCTAVAAAGAAAEAGRAEGSRVGAAMQQVASAAASIMSMEDLQARQAGAPAAQRSGQMGSLITASFDDVSYDTA